MWPKALYKKVIKIEKEGKTRKFPKQNRKWIQSNTFSLGLKCISSTFWPPENGHSFPEGFFSKKSTMHILYVAWDKSVCQIDDMTASYS
uniref:Uncharacterized protein n=1 Tax=Anguilla anguilla TaxID=7936 RepID=A0A0E9WGJ7_ANGAN